MKLQTTRLTLSAVLIALSAVLSLVRVYDLPLGGSITLLSMLPVCMIGVCFGTRWGLFCSILYAFVQILLDLGKLMGYGMTPTIWLGSLMFDYFIAFGSLGLAGIFREKGTGGICAGVCVSLLIRFVSHFISGVILFAEFAPEGWNVSLYSLCYNGSYMLPEMILTVLGGILLFRLPQMRKMISEQRN